jgi:protocatechuate 3,4-dioxygenase beta subunit
MSITRRAALAPVAVAPVLPFLLAPAFAQASPLPLTPECRDGAAATVAQTEGPFFRADAPLRRDLAADVPGGARITIGGFVVDVACRPIAGALVQIWHADDAGAYDNRGQRLRGQQRTDADGAWAFATIVPANYQSRTRHYHFKVQRPGGRVLTTQLYFPDDPQNRRDRLFDPRLVLRLSEAGGRAGRFDFVVA